MISSEDLGEDFIQTRLDFIKYTRICLDLSAKVCYNKLIENPEFDGGSIMVGNVVAFLVGTICIILGLVISFWAMVKYNKGIF